jgi:hypothetical protein
MPYERVHWRILTWSAQWMAGDQVEKGALEFLCEFLDDSPANITYWLAFGDPPTDGLAKSQ